jgi:hypothetical protein
MRAQALDMVSFIGGVGVVVVVVFRVGIGIGMAVKRSTYLFARTTISVSEL